MPSLATSEQLSGSLRQIDKTVDTVYQSIDPSAREAFNDLSTKFLNTLAVRADVTRLVQSGQSEVSPQALQQLAGDRTAAILAKASDLAKTQTAEAQGAERLAETVRAGERRDEAQTRLDPASVKDLTEERRAAAITERSAAQTDREATRGARGRAPDRRQSGADDSAKSRQQRSNPRTASHRARARVEGG